MDQLDVQKLLDRLSDLNGSVERIAVAMERIAGALERIASAAEQCALKGEIERVSR